MNQCFLCVLLMFVVSNVVEVNTLMYTSQGLVLFYENTEYITSCGIVLINQHAALTIATCVTEQPVITTENISPWISLGETIINLEEFCEYSLKINIHPGYKNTDKDINNIAALFFPYIMQFAEKSLAKMPIEVKPNAMLKIYGYSTSKTNNEVKSKYIISDINGQFQPCEKIFGNHNKFKSSLKCISNNVNGDKGSPVYLKINITLFDPLVALNYKLNERQPNFAVNLFADPIKKFVEKYEKYKYSRNDFL